MIERRREGEREKEEGREGGKVRGREGGKEREEREGDREEGEINLLTSAAYIHASSNAHSVRHVLDIYSVYCLVVHILVVVAPKYCININLTSAHYPEVLFNTQIVL